MATRLPSSARWGLTRPASWRRSKPAGASARPRPRWYRWPDRTLDVPFGKIEMNTLTDPVVAMPDVQSSVDTRHIAIQRVGVLGVRHPMLIEAGSESLPTVAEWELTRSEEHTSELQSREKLVC